MNKKLKPITRKKPPTVKKPKPHQFGRLQIPPDVRVVTFPPHDYTA